MDERGQRIDIYIDHERDIQVRCPVCGKYYGIYDHAPERIYRHLNTCQMETYIHVKPPRVNCPNHGVKQIDSEVGENGSEMSYLFETTLSCMRSTGLQTPWAKASMRRSRRSSVWLMGFGIALIIEQPSISVVVA